MEAQKKQTLNIKVTPSDAIVLIDNEMVEKRMIELPLGSHSYNVAASGYLAQSGNVNLTANSPGKLIVELDRKTTANQDKQNNAVQQANPNNYTPMQAQNATQQYAQQLGTQLSSAASDARQTSSTIKASGTVVEYDGSPIIGAVVSVQGTDDGTVTDFDGKFSLTVPAGKKIHVRYVGMASQTLEPASDMIVKLRDEHEYVDLGLSVKWATCNVGAEKPEDAGSYLAWGEMNTKKNYSWSTYFDSVSGSAKNFKKYAIGKQTILDADDDAARARWGSPWRMPTKSEQEELLLDCTWVKMVLNGKPVYKVTSKKNGNSIYMPIGGLCDGKDISYVGKYGGYWSSTLYEGNSDAAWNILLIEKIQQKFNARISGLNVRPVCP